MFAVRMVRVRCWTRIALYMSALVAAAVSCRETPARPERTDARVMAAVDTALGDVIGSRPYGLGTTAAQRRIIDSLGPTPSLGYYWTDEGSRATPGAITVTDWGSGTEFRILPEPVWTLRDVASVRVDSQPDSTALVVLVLGTSRNAGRFLKAGVEREVSGAVLIEGQVMQLRTSRHFEGSEVPVPLGPFPAPDAERLAQRLRAALSQHM